MHSPCLGNMHIKSPWRYWQQCGMVAWRKASSWPCTDLSTAQQMHAGVCQQSVQHLCGGLGDSCWQRMLEMLIGVLPGLC